MNRTWRVSQSWLSRLAAIGVVAAFVVGGLANPVRADLADGFEVDIPVTTIVYADEGSITPVANPVQVPEENYGERCLVEAHSQNQKSVHPDNDLIVESGSSQVIVPDVEAVPGGSTDGQGILTLGETITVDLRMGPDERFSAGLIVKIDCTVFRLGRIIVVKEVTEGSDTSEAFDFTTDYGSGGFSLADGEQNDSGDLTPGTYSVSETVPEGWTLDSATCDDGSSIDAIDLAAYETVTCTFVNDQDDEVEAAVVVTVGATCEVVDGEGVGQINVGVSVDDGATVVVRDSDGQVVATVTEDTSISVDEGATYTWEATPNEGFEFPSGSDTSGTITVDTCTDEVEAAVVVTVGASCVVVDDEGVGRINVGVSVDDGATVVVRDSDGQVVATVTEDASISVDEGATYTWEATPSTGFEFPSGSATSGTITVDTCSVLPFTGANDSGFAILAAVLVLTGSAVLYSQRRYEDS